MHPGLTTLPLVLTVSSSAWAQPPPRPIRTTDATIHHSESFAPASKSAPGACIYAVSPTTARKLTIEATYARCKAGRFNDAVGRPRQGDDLWLIAKLPGVFDPLTYPPHLAAGEIRSDGQIDLEFQAVSISYASPMGQTEVHATVHLGQLPAGRHALRLRLASWHKDLDASGKPRRQPSQEVRPIAIDESFQIFAAGEPAGDSCDEPIQASQDFPARLALTIGKRGYVGYGPAFAAEARVFGCPTPIAGSLYAMVNSPLAKAMEAHPGLVVDVVPGTQADKPAGAFVRAGPGSPQIWKVVSFEAARTTR